MHLFTDYIQPLTLWLYEHPHLALIITFLVSFAESLAIIGSIIPGSVTMTAIGIIAGSGIMRIDLTLLAAILGAIAGDSASYMLGYLFSDRLTTFWPFKRYPNWINYGKDFFARHGGKSVLIGRFIGPLRSIIPVIAGMMHMSHLRFYFANIISAIAWSLLYVLPGVLIGKAGKELSPEIATRLFVIVLFILVCIWLLSIAIKWLILFTNRLMKTHVNQFWSWTLKHRYLSKFANLLTPKLAINHYSTAMVFLLFVLSTFLFIILAILVVNSNCIQSLNQTIYLLFQSLRANSFDAFFIIFSRVNSPFNLGILFLSICFITSFYKDWRSLSYWIGLSLSSLLILDLLHHLILSPRPQGLFDQAQSSSFPSKTLTLATCFGISFYLYITIYSKARFKSILKILILILLLLLGLTPLYLGDHWFSDVLGSYLAGLSLCSGHWLFYQRAKRKIYYYPPFISLIIFSLVFLGTAIVSFYTYEKELRNHQPYFEQFVFTDEQWWNQTKPLLPVYHFNRIGKPISLFNIQYAGTLNKLEVALTKKGWKKQSESLMNKIMNRVSGVSTSPKLSLIPQLYLNKKPLLIMSFESEIDHSIHILRIWRSNYHLKHYKQPIWLGAVHQPPSKSKTGNSSSHSIRFIENALPNELFLQRRFLLPDQFSIESLQTPVEPVLLLVKEKFNEKQN